MHNVIFIVRDGPEDKPNRFYPAICMGPASVAQTFQMGEVDDDLDLKKLHTVHHHNILRLDWERSQRAQLKAHHESLSHLRRTAPVPSPIGQQAEPVLPGGTGLA